MNKDHKAMEIIVFGENQDWGNTRGGTISFNNLSLDQLNQLIEQNFIKLEGNQNDSPTTAEFKEFMEKYPQVDAHGYVVSPERADYRISIEGLGCNKSITPELIQDFTNSFHSADEFDIEDTYLRAWWD